MARMRSRTSQRLAPVFASKATISARIREFRKARYGDRGGPELARVLGIPARSLYNYETGVTIPAEILLLLVERADASPEWLLTGKGPMTRSES